MNSAALNYARAGVHVLPCDPTDKRPLGRLVRHGLKDATTDADTIAAWWRQHPNAKIGIACGASGLVVIDIDVKHDNGFEALHRRIRELGPLPMTRIAATPSGGQHWYTKAPEGVTIRPSAGKLGVGLDVRAGNSYVIAPPSPGYQWVADGRLAPLPSPWVEALRVQERVPGPKPQLAAGSKRLERYCLSALDSACRELIDTPRGQRNATLWNHAAAIGGLVHYGAFGRGDAFDALEWACAHWKTRTPMKDRATIERGLSFGIEHPRDVMLGGHDARDSAA